MGLPHKPTRTGPRRRVAGITATVLWVALTVSPAVPQETAPSTVAQGALRFPGFADAPAFEVVPRRDDLFFYPCAECHEFMDASDEVRELDAPHDIEDEHGNGRLWCIQCHSMTDRNKLWTLLREPVDFDEAYIVCGGCHASRQKDWYYGAHGKRVGGWRDGRVIYNCTHCHDPHSPSIKPRKPSAPPPVRAGLERQHGETHEVQKVWERDADTREGGETRDH